MRTLPAVLAARPNARVVIVGSDGKGYGGGAGGWRERMISELGDRLDLSRIHFVGRVDYADFIRLLQVSSAHVYLSYPFVLSWSLLEAMSLGCVIVGSDTAPIREVVTHWRTGLLADFFDVDALAQLIVGALARPDEHRPLREAARNAVVERYDLDRICLPAHLKLIDTLLAGRRPID
jgi:glycosyltransferase involved in cell wall biosynthesis